MNHEDVKGLRGSFDSAFWETEKDDRPEVRCLSERVEARHFTVFAHVSVAVGDVLNSVLDGVWRDQSSAKPRLKDISLGVFPSHGDAREFLFVDENVKEIGPREDGVRAEARPVVHTVFDDGGRNEATPREGERLEDAPSLNIAPGTGDQNSPTSSLQMFAAIDPNEELN